jgi:hypothetical protein
MSGGHFGYQQYRLNDIASMVDELIERNDVPDEFEYVRNYTPETIEKFRLASRVLRVAAIMTQRIDWLVSGDDGEDTFHERLKEDLREVNRESSFDISGLLGGE